jgi:DNA-binding XRE family transcriptional regulator
MDRLNVSLKMRMFELRKKQEDVARKVGISPGTMSAIVQGKTEPRVSVAMKIARELDTTVEQLWGHLLAEEQND